MTFWEDLEVAMRLIVDSYLGRAASLGAPCVENWEMFGRRPA
jgi:hypothetical protein